jgi:ferrous iron transport protein B
VNELKTLKIALVGNPNSGKTSVFNGLTGAHQKVANFPGVTVEKRTGQCSYNGYEITVVDLPGIYSLSTQSPDEKVSRDFIINEKPDIIINILDTGNLERGLYLTVQMIEMGIDIVLDLNMWDEARASGIEIDTDKLSLLLGIPVVKTVANRSQGLNDLLAAAVLLHEDRHKGHRHPPVSYGPKIDDLVANLTDHISGCGRCRECGNPRWLAVKLLEGDEEIIGRCPNKAEPTADLSSKLKQYRHHLQDTTRQEPDIAVAEGRYGYIAGMVREVMKSSPSNRMQLSVQIDNILTHRYWGYPIFLLMMWIIFQATFRLGAYPAGWIDSGATWLAHLAEAALPTGFISDMISNGLIAGLGSVIVFLPNIVILFMGISFLEDFGYMARAAFLMDKLMHLMGLHGKSFIPLLMGFGCNVPAIMATRTLESRRDRIFTILLIPLMSCSARLPVYVLFAGIFFGKQAGNIIFSIYLIGIAAAIGLARLLRKTILPPDSTPFVIELPPYRRPTIKSVLIHMWERTKIYLRKIGGVVLIASLILWILGNFPRKPENSFIGGLPQTTLEKAAPSEMTVDNSDSDNLKNAARLEYSLIGRIGKTLFPIFSPLGFTWQMDVSIIAGFFAKEIVVSTLGVLYHAGDDPTSVSAGLVSPDSGLTRSTAYAFMVFILLYTPCIAAVAAIRREIGPKWMLYSIVFQSLMAWLLAFVTFRIGDYFF